MFVSFIPPPIFWCCTLYIQQKGHQPIIVFVLLFVVAVFVTLVLLECYNSIGQLHCGGFLKLWEERVTLKLLTIPCCHCKEDHIPITLTTWNKKFFRQESTVTDSRGCTIPPKCNIHVMNFKHPPQPTAL